MNKPERAFVALIILTAVIAVGLALLQRGVYGWTIFVLLPMILGGLASWVLHLQTTKQALFVGSSTTFAATMLLLLLGREGLACVAMALPLTIPLGAVGSWIVYRFGGFGRAEHAAMLLLLTPAGVTWDTQARPPLFEVHTALEIAAAPEQVWKHVVMFSELPEPNEWFFRAGLAYRKRARIEGSGPGAIRYCEFSTGPFVEPIEVWEAPRLLKFRVTENPAPMHEWSPYAQVLPKHLHGYFISQKGQFRLTRLPNNRTLVEGTTWYQHGLWPTQYWRWWSDAIIHRIHLRVLSHIRTLSEAESAKAW